MFQAGRSRNVAHEFIENLTFNIPMIDHSSLKVTFYFTWILTFLKYFFFSSSVHWNIFWFNQPSPLRKQYFSFYFFLFFFSFENAVGESSPQNGSTCRLNLVLIVIVPLAIFILAIVVVFGISCFRRHQGHKNQGKFLASFAYLCIFLSFFFFFFFFFRNMMSRWNIEARIGSHSLVWYSTLLSWCEAFSFFTRLINTFFH